MRGWFGFGHATLEGIFGYVLAPLAWIMGVDWSDATLAGSLIGQKLAINEFVAYLNFSPYLQTGGALDVKKSWQSTSLSPISTSRRICKLAGHWM
nr:nucleoside transporter C-terminal domain-containing protein [Citrobacter sp. wls714]